MTSNSNIDKNLSDTTKQPNEPVDWLDERLGKSLVRYRASTDAYYSEYTDGVMTEDEWVKVRDKIQAETIDDIKTLISEEVDSQKAEMLTKIISLGEAGYIEARGKAKQAIQQELLKAKWEIVNMAKQRAEDDDVYTLQAFAEDMDTYLQAKLKGDE